jgi:hypothetical protein
MLEWKSPEIWELGFENTKGNPGKCGNDQYIPDCIENFLDHFIPSGPFKPSCS